jgi:L-alanine-DL-glutamate epimerase-like enolase superfamily enzyme
MPLRITNVFERTIPLGSDIRNAVISFSSMTASVVAVVCEGVGDGRRLVGYGHTSIGRYEQGKILRERLIPRVLEADPEDLLDPTGGNFDPSAVWEAAMSEEKPGGHGDRAHAMAALDMAVWDLAAKVREQPLYAFIGERYGRSDVSPRVATYAAGGYYYEDGGLEALRAEIRRHLAAGFTAAKIKIGGAPLAEDLRRIDASLEILGDPTRLAVDANGRFRTAEALEYAHALGSYGLRWFEEPVDPLDLEGHRDLAAEYPGPLATGENLFAAVEVQNLLRFGGLRAEIDILQMDPGLAYGLTEYGRMLTALAEEGWMPRSIVPHGGHRFSLHVAAGLGLGGCEAYPEIFDPIGTFGPDVAIEDGRATITDAEGIGLERIPQFDRWVRGLADVAAPAVDAPL